MFEELPDKTEIHEERISIQCYSATCDFRARGNVIKRPDSRNLTLDQGTLHLLKTHHLSTGRGQPQTPDWSTLTAHSQFSGFDDSGRQYLIEANSYGVIVSKP